MDDTTPRHDTPGLPRPRTRGARRRIQPPDSSSSSARHSQRNASGNTGFPALPTHRPLTSGWIPPRSPSHLQPDAESSTLRMLQRHQVDPRDEENNRMHAEALRDRLQATGMKRSIVQAQLFPEVASRPNQRDTQQDPCRTARSNRQSNPYPFTKPRTSSSEVYQDSNAASKPLVPSLSLHATGGVLIPSRPTTSSSAVPQRRQLMQPPNSARELSPSSKGSIGVEPRKVPMTARDRYYIEKRASTASAASPLSGSKRRAPSVPSQSSDAALSAESTGDSVGLQRQVQSGTANAVREDDIARFNPKQTSAELPKRHELLTRTADFKTLTESIAEHLASEATAQRKDNATAQSLVSVSGAVPRDSFLYLRRVDSNPYNLVLTNHAHIDPNDYYTVSRLGITHFAHNSSEFMPLEKFERENYLYSLIIKVCLAFCAV